MKFSLKSKKISQLEVDTLNLFLWEDEEIEKYKEFPGELLLYIKDAVKRENFNQDRDEVLLLSSKGIISAYKLIITGLGKKKDFDRGILAEQVAKSIRKSKENKAVKIGIVLADDWCDLFGIKNSVQTIVEAVSLADYRFLKYKSEEEKNKIRMLEEVILSLPFASLSQAEEGIREGQIMSKATLFARDLINEPPQVTTPTYLAQEAMKIGKNSNGLVKVTILE